MFSNPRLEDFFTMPHAERMASILEAICVGHRFHYENNAAYRKTVSARGLGPQAGFDDQERMLRSAAITFKSYIDRTGFFPQDRPLDFMRWVNEQLSAPLPEGRFSQLEEKYKGFEAMLDHIETIYADLGLEIVTSSGTSGKASVVARDRETITLSFQSFFTGIERSWGIAGGTNLVFVMPRQTRVAMARTAVLGVQELDWSKDALVFFTMPFKASTDIIRIRAGRIYRRGFTGLMEKRFLNPLINWANEKRGQPKVVKRTLEALDQCIASGKPLMLLGGATQLHLFTSGEINFPAGSRIATGGGMKERYPYTFDQIREDLRKAFPGTPVCDVYGMSEANWAAFECSEGNYHLPPWVYPVVVDNDDHIVRAPEAEGLLAFFDPIGGGKLLPPFFQTADHVCLVNGGSAHDPGRVCSCGYDTAYIRGKILRVDLLGEAGCAGQV